MQPLAVALPDPPPGWLPRVAHPDVRRWALHLHSLWGALGRQVGGACALPSYTPCGVHWGGRLMGACALPSDTPCGAHWAGSSVVHCRSLRTRHVGCTGPAGACGACVLPVGLAPLTLPGAHVHICMQR